MAFGGGIQRVAAQPALIFPVEGVYVLALALPSALKGAAQQTEPPGVERSVIDALRIVPERHALHLFPGEKPVGDQLFQINEIRVPSKRRVGLVRRVAVAGRTERQDLPVFLSRLLKKIGKLSRLGAERSDAMG